MIQSPQETHLLELQRLQHLPAPHRRVTKMAPFDSGYSSNLINKLSPLIEGQVPDFIQADHAVFVRFLKNYYQYLESGELRLTVSIDNMLLEVQTDSFLLLEDGSKLVLEHQRQPQPFL